jgi:hypothetical protein
MPIRAGGASKATRSGTCQVKRYKDDRSWSGLSEIPGGIPVFRFGKKKSAPPLCPANPGIGTEARVAFSTGDRSWTEKVNLVSLAAEAFKKQGYGAVTEKTWLHHPDSGFLILPQLVEIHPMEGGGVRTVTTMQTNHPLLSPNGVFEYQHATGDSIAESISNGFDQWLQMDFVPLLDALLPKPESCTALEWAFPATGGKPVRVRRAVLGPPARFVEKRPSRPEGNLPEEHPFCPCCLLTNSFEAFREFIEGDGFYGLRLFAARDGEGMLQADCRVNGGDWAKGAEALREYAKTWPKGGFEFRKQYVVLQSINKGAEPEGVSK